MSDFYNQGSQQTLRQLGSDLTGLQERHIETIRRKYGRNLLTDFPPKSLFLIVCSQFKDIMIILLIVAAVVSFTAGEHTDAFIIVAIILVNAYLGASQEKKAQKTVRLLKTMLPQFAMVLRDNVPKKIETAFLVPGDIIILTAGDIVPADARLITITSFRTDESSLTGESQAAEKQTAAINENNAVPGDQKNMVFKGSPVSTGTAKAVVTATGMNTELGKIAGLLRSAEQKTPLQKKLALLSKQLAAAVLIICVIIFGYGVWHGLPPFRSFLTALSLAVAALPEALPAVVTIALASGAKRLAKQEALMKNLPSVETLGSVTYICTDKTGTLTQNKMTVQKADAVTGKKDLLLNAMALNNEVHISAEGMIGDSTETALVDYAAKNNVTKGSGEAQFPLISRFPFDSERMLMSTLHRYEGKWILFVKGAPVKIAERLGPADSIKAGEWLDINRQWASEGLRVLFFACKIFDTDPGEITAESETNLDFIGMTALIDPPREEAIEAVRQCKIAGIKTVMITGDQPLTALAIAKRLGFSVGEKHTVITGAEMNAFTKAEFNRMIEDTSVYARVSPQQKLSIVKALQARGEFVAMTGDGVNDAPSLKQADIGIAMGITGTDVSKEAADMILLDDNFATIIKAIKEGRRIYANIRKFIRYILSCNLAEILTIVSASLAGFAAPILPVQILWINLVTDGLPGIALINEPAENDVMSKSPRKPGEHIFAGGMLPAILLSAVVMTIAALGIQIWAAQNGYTVTEQQTMVFTTLCFIQLGNALSVRSSSAAIFSEQLLKNRLMWVAIGSTVLLQTLLVYVPALQKIFKTAPLDFRCFIAVAFTAVICTCFIEAVKFLRKRRARLLAAVSKTPKQA